MPFFARVLALLSYMICGTAFAQQLASAQLQGNVDDRSQDEMSQRVDIFDKVAAAVNARDFAALNKMSDDYRASRSRTPSGTWKLAYFYYGFAGPLPITQASGECVNPVPAFAKAWAAYDQSQPSPYIVEATSYLNQAQCYRGDGYAQKVPLDVLTRATEISEAARRLLDSHREVASNDPQYYSMLILANRSTGRGKTDLKNILEEASGKEPYYYGTYFEAAQMLMPRWYGAPGDLEWLAQYAVQKTRKNDGFGTYARIFWILSGFHQDDSSALNWAVVKQGMDDLLNRYPNIWNAANFAYLSCYQGDRTALTAFLDKSRMRSFPAEWQLRGKEWEKCLEWYATVQR